MKSFESQTAKEAEGRVATSQLVQRALQGDKHAFCALVLKYQSAVYGLAFHYLKNFADAEDVAQEVFLTAYQQLGTLKSPEKFASWLNGITANLCKMWLRRRREMVSVDEITQREEYTLFENARVPTPDEVYEQQEFHEQVMEAIAQLPEPNRIVLTLCYIDGLSYKEIGDFLSVPIGTVRSRLHRAKKMLKEEMVSLAEEMFEKRKLSEEFTKKISDKIKCPHCQKEFSFDDLRVDKPEDAPKDIQDDTKAHLEKALAVLDKHSKLQDVDIEQAQADALKEIASFGVIREEDGKFRTQLTVVDSEGRYLYHECQSFIGTIRNRTSHEHHESKEGWFIHSLFRNMGRETLWRYSHFPEWDWYVLVEGHWYLYPNPDFQFY